MDDGSPDLLFEDGFQVFFFLYQHHNLLQIAEDNDYTMQRFPARLHC